MQHERFRVLDGWRGISALLVALIHLNAYGYFVDVPLFGNAWLFVDFFFVLSGFVITHAYLDRLGGWRQTAGFILRRFGRLWPLHVTVLALFVAVELSKLALTGGMTVDHPPFSEEKSSVAAILTNLLMIHSLGVHDTVTWNYPSWSISTEFYTYLVFAIIVSVTRTQRARLIVPGLLAIGSAAVVVAFARDPMDTTYDFGIFRCLCGFFTGYLVYHLWRRQKAAGVPYSGAAIEVATVGAVVVFVSLADNGPLAFAAPVIFGAVVLVFADEDGPVSRLMKMRPIARLGTWSYSIYMVHAFIIQVLDRGFNVVGKLAGTPVRIMQSVPWEREPIELIFVGSRAAMDCLAVAYLVVVVAAAAVTYRVIEQPGRRVFNRLAAITPPVSSPSPAAAGGARASRLSRRTAAPK
jgi:peptidoglycan/LPS O-acetylase OafA/YrhL